MAISWDWLKPDSWVNVPLLTQPMNWVVVFIAATIWLLLFHTLMTGFQAMASTGQAAFGATGQVAAPTAATGAFSVMGDISTPGTGSDVAWFQGGGLTGMSPWTDSNLARYAEDGWAAN